jgi:hypothetical protein
MMFKRNKKSPSPESKSNVGKASNPAPKKSDASTKPQANKGKSELLTTPKEREVPPQAFKRSKDPENNAAKTAVDRNKPDVLQLKRENHKLQRELEKMAQLHAQQLEDSKKEYEDQLAQM